MELNQHIQLKIGQLLKKLQVGETASCVIRSNQLIDITNSSKLFARLDFEVTSYSATLIPTISIVDSAGNVTDLGTIKVVNSTTPIECFDVSGYTGEYYLQITLPGPKHTIGYAAISLVWYMLDIMID